MARPRFKPTKPQRERVKLLKAMGWSDTRIAAQILHNQKPISRTTLLSAFPSELEFGADAKRVENLEAMQAAAKKGNASAGKWLAERFDAGRAAEQLEGRESRASQPAPRPEPEERPGKKQQRQDAAAKVAGLYAPPAGPSQKPH